MDTLRFLQNHGYVTIFLGLLLEYLGLPIPGELILIFFGALIYWGKLELWVAVSVGLAAVLLGNHFWFFAGQRGGRRWLHLLCRATLGSNQCISRTEHFFRRYGSASLVFAKFVPGFRTFAVPLAGMTGVAYPRFLLFDTVGSLFWLVGALSLGMLMATQLNRAVAHIQHLGTAITAAVVLAALIVFILRLRKRLKYGDPMKEFQSERGSEDLMAIGGDSLRTAEKPFGCLELWAGNERTHRHIELVGLEGDVISLPSGAREGGDLYALFSCAGEQVARIVLADCVGHGYLASRIASHIHQLIHQHRDVRDSSRLLAALNDEFTLTGQSPGVPLRLTTAVTATFDRVTGEFNFAYAAHPRMVLWRARENRWFALGEGLEGLPMGIIAGEVFTQQSIRIEPDDIVLLFSDGLTEVFSPDGELLTADGFMELARTTLAGFSPRVPLHTFVEALVDAIKDFHGADKLEDDLTLLTLRRSGRAGELNRRSASRAQ